MRGSLRHCPRCLSRLSVLGRHPRRRRSPAAPGVFQDASKPSDSRSYHCPVRSAMFTRFRQGRAVARRTARARTAASCPRRRAPCSPPFARHRPREEPAPRGAGHRPEHQPACPSRLPDGPRRRPVRTKRDSLSIPLSPTFAANIPRPQVHDVRHVAVRLLIHWVPTPLGILRRGSVREPVSRGAHRAHFQGVRQTDSTIGTDPRPPRRSFTPLRPSTCAHAGAHARPHRQVGRGFAPRRPLSPTAERARGEVRVRVRCTRPGDRCYRE